MEVASKPLGCKLEGCQPQSIGSRNGRKAMLTHLTHLYSHFMPGDGDLFHGL